MTVTVYLDQGLCKTVAIGAPVRRLAEQRARSERVSELASHSAKETLGGSTIATGAIV